MSKTPPTCGERTYESHPGEAGVDLVRTSFQAPNMNAFAERWVRSITHECLNRWSSGTSAELSATTARTVDLSDTLAVGPRNVLACFVSDNGP